MTAGAALATEAGPPLKQALVDQAIEAVAWRGIRNLTMRAVSAEAGGTTAAIVHHYGSKSGLIAAAIDVAMREEEALHAELAAKLKGHVIGHLNFVEWLSQHLLHRTTNTHARFWSELLFHASAVSGANIAIAAWHEMRTQFWAEILLSQGCNPSLASYIVTYLCMEEGWAQGLSDFEEYPILLRETVRALTAKMFGQPWNETNSVSDWLEERLGRFSLEPPQDPEALDERLLSIAAQDILDYGVKLNQRRITELAGASPSMIAYHFDSMSSFRNQAVWRAMLRPVDDPLNPYNESRTAHTIEDWASRMADIIMPAHGAKRAGFYVSFARTIGEIALLSHRQPEMRPLAEHLRILDGTASFHAGKTIWKDVVPLQRGQASAFAVWAKGQAVLNGVLEYDLEFNRNALVGAATQLI